MNRYQFNKVCQNTRYFKQQLQSVGLIVTVLFLAVVSKVRREVPNCENANASAAATTVHPSETAGEKVKAVTQSANATNGFLDLTL